MTPRVYNVLFLCTGNSARSILAEALLNHVGDGHWRGYSAGSHPTGVVNPGALALLAEKGIPSAALRSKSWEEFARPSAPQMDFVITVCDNAAGEVCPIWPGRPTSAHFGVADPAHVQDRAARAAAFRDALQVLSHRIGLLTRLPLESLDDTTLRSRLRAIGETTG